MTGIPAHVVLIEKNEMLREKLAGNISSDRRIEAVTQVSSFSGIQKTLCHIECPLVMLNIDEGVKLIDVIKKIKRYNPESRVLLYQSVGVNMEYNMIALQMGADCFMALDASDDIVGHIAKECIAKEKYQRKKQVTSI